MNDYQERYGRNNLNEELAKYIFVQLALGLKDIHIKQIVHRDIKHKNIFLNNKSMSPKITIADFGVSIRL